MNRRTEEATTSDLERAKRRLTSALAAHPPATSTCRLLQHFQMTSTHAESLSPLESLPPELLLRIIDSSSPQAISRLSATSRALRSIARSETVWKKITQAVLARSRAREEKSHTAEHGSRTDEDEELWWRRASFLLPISQHLGYFLSSTPYT